MEKLATTIGRECCSGKESFASFGPPDERRDSKTLLGELLVKDIRSAGAETKLRARDMKPHDMVDYNDLVDYDDCYVENSYVACWHPRRSAEYRLPSSHCQRIETQCWHNTLECDDEEYMEELTCIQLLRRAEHCVQRLRSQFSELLRTAKLSELLVYRQVRNVLSFCETSFVVSFFCSLLSLSVH